MKAKLIVAASLTLWACGSNTVLQAIDGPEDDSSGGGAGGRSSGSSSTTSGGGDPTGGGGSPDLVGPTLVVVHDEGITSYFEVADQGTVLASTAEPVPAGIPRGAAQLGPHLVLSVTAGNGSEVQWRQYDNFVNMAGSAGFTDATLQLEPIAASSQIPGVPRADDQGGLWMLSGGFVLGNGTPSNGLRWSPTGSIGGPWSVYPSTPALDAYAILPGARSAAASTADGLVQLELRRGDKSIALFGEISDTSYIALETHAHSLYGITVSCAGCTGAGQLHIWRDLEPGDPLSPPPALGAPDASVPLPDDFARACSLTVGDEAVVVGACRGPFLVPHDPKLYVFRSPDAITGATTPDTTLTLPEEPLGIVSHHRPAITGANLSVYVRTATPVGLIYDDRDGSLEDTGDAFGTLTNPPLIPTDVALVD